MISELSEPTLPFDITQQNKGLSQIGVSRQARLKFVSAMDTISLGGTARGIMKGCEN